jgi:hypothetical protein
MKRLDDFFGEDEVEPSVRYELPENSDETIVVVREYFFFLKF